MLFDLVGLIFQGFVIVWILIIAMIPNIFMGGLTFSILATVLTYFKKRSSA